MTSMDPIRERAIPTASPESAAELLDQFKDQSRGLAEPSWAIVFAQAYLDALDKVERLEKLAVPVTTQHLAEAAQHIARIGDEARKHYEKCLELEAEVAKLTDHRQAMIDAAMAQAERANGYGEIAAKIEAERDTLRELAERAQPVIDAAKEVAICRSKTRMNGLPFEGPVMSDLLKAYAKYDSAFPKPATQTEDK